MFLSRLELLSFLLCHYFCRFCLDIKSVIVDNDNNNKIDSTAGATNVDDNDDYDDASSFSSYHYIVICFLVIIDGGAVLPNGTQGKHHNDSSIHPTRCAFYES